jgi:hypothetical protein
VDIVMMGVMIFLGILGTILFSGRKVLEMLEESDLERRRIQNDHERVKALERIAHNEIYAWRAVALKEQEVKQNIEFLHYMRSMQEMAFLAGEFKESAQLKYDCEVFRKRLSEKYGENTVRYLTSVRDKKKG